MVKHSYCLLLVCQQIVQHATEIDIESRESEIVMHENFSSPQLLFMCLGECDDTHRHT